MSYLNGRILVTGATGFLGGAVARSLAEAGIEVIASGRDQDKLDQIEEHVGSVLRKDLTKPFTIGETKALGQLTAIVNCAGCSSPRASLEDLKGANTVAMRNLVNLARDQLDCRLVHISTADIYAAKEDRTKVREAMEQPPSSNLAVRSKIETETLLRDSEQNAVILRPQTIYGPGDPHLFPKILKAAKERSLPLLRGGAAATDLVHIDDVVRAVGAALEADIKQPGRAFNISGGEQINIKSLIDAVCHYCGVPVNWQSTPLGAAKFNAHSMTFMASIGLMKSPPAITPQTLDVLAYTRTLDIGAAERVLKWTPKVPFHEGLSDTLEALYP